MHPILLQAIYYAIVMFLTVFIIAFFQRSFFWKFWKVKTSLGRLTIVKSRGKLRDCFYTAEEKDGTLIWKVKGGQKTVPLKDNFTYSAIGIRWIDYDEMTGGFVKPDFSTTDTNDAEAYDNLIMRILMRPTITDQKMKIILITSVIGLIGIGICIFFLFRFANQLTTIQNTLFEVRNLLQKSQTIVPATI